MKYDDRLLRHVISPLGGNLIDLYVDDAAMQIDVNYPGITVEHLMLVTNLTLGNGLQFESLKELAQGLKLTSYCGHTGVNEENIMVMPGQLQANLILPVGPTSMYQNSLLLETTKGESFKSLIEQTIYRVQLVGIPIVTLFAVEGSGEHQHGHDQMDHADHSGHSDNSGHTDHSDHSNHSGHKDKNSHQSHKSHH